MKTLSRKFLFLFLAAILASPLHSPTPAKASSALSNDLPKNLVEQLFESGLWNGRFDDPATAEAQDLRRFLELTARTEIPVEPTLDNLFGSDNGKEGTPGTLPRLYPTKIVILRYLFEQNTGARRAQLEKFTARWKSHYLELALATVRMAGINDLDPIAENFARKVATREIALTDLSPAERSRLAPRLPERQARELTALATGGVRRFDVTGLYNAESRYFAIDFARPIEETIVTFIHEMVHAADPAQEQHRKAYEVDLEPVLAALSRWLSAAEAKLNESTLAVARDIVEHVFFETGMGEISNLAETIRSKRISALEQSLKESKDPTDEELTRLNRWMRAAIGLTIENEYRAYGFSLLAYSALRTRIQATPPSQQHQRFLDRLLTGDKVFASNLSVGMNPFPKTRSDLFQQFVVKAAGPVGPTTPVYFATVARVLDRLELAYLEQTRAFLLSLNDRFAKTIAELSRNALEAPQNVLPDWARPGGFDLPSNPFHVLSARITTGWVLRFRQNVHNVLSQLQELNEPLMTTRLGILDLHDITRGERKLIGISYEDSPWASDPVELDPRLNADVDTISRDMAKYFTLVRWQPVHAEPGKARYRALPSEDVMENLTRLRALKALLWLDQTFPPFKTTLLGVKSFLQRIRDGIYNLDDLTRERAAELEKELVGVWETAGVSRDEFMRLGLLWKEITNLRQFAHERKYPELDAALLEKNQFVVRMLDNFGVSGTETVREFQAKLKKDAQGFYKQLETFTEKCDDLGSKDKARLAGFWPEKGPFSLGQYSFPLTLLCYQERLYAVRQPGDFIKFMTTQIRDGAPEARIFAGARPVQLSPLRSLKSLKEVK